MQSDQPEGQGRQRKQVEQLEQAGQLELAEWHGWCEQLGRQNCVQPNQNA